LSDAAREYELVLMLDPEIPEERREQISSETRGRIESGGTLKHDMGWGMRKMAYEIRQRTEADYRLFRFETDGGVLDDLNHNLRIADGVLRFRIFQVDSGAPAIVPPPAMTTAGGAQPRGGRRPSAGAAPADSASEGDSAPDDDAPGDEAPGDEAEPADDAPEQPSAPSAGPEGGQGARDEPADSSPEEGPDSQAER
jgi:small subunit ribosomal protein S6